MAYYVVPSGHNRVEVDRNGYVGSIGENEFDIFEFAASAPALCKRDPDPFRDGTLEGVESNSPASATVIIVS